MKEKIPDISTPSNEPEHLEELEEHLITSDGTEYVLSTVPDPPEEVTEEPGTFHQLSYDDYQAVQITEKIKEARHRVDPSALTGTSKDPWRKKRAKLLETMINENLTPLEAAAHIGIRSDYAIRWFYREKHYLERIKKIAPFLRYDAIKVTRSAARIATNPKDQVYAARALFDFADRLEGIQDPVGNQNTTITVNIANLQSNPLISAALGLDYKSTTEALGSEAKEKGDRDTIDSSCHLDPSGALPIQEPVLAIPDDPEK